RSNVEGELLQVTSARPGARDLFSTRNKAGAHHTSRAPCLAETHGRTLEDGSRGTRARTPGGIGVGCWEGGVRLPTPRSATTHATEDAQSVGAPAMIERLKQRPKPATNADEDIDLAEARRFLTALDPNADVFCFQTYDDYPERQLKDKKLSWCDTGKFDDLKRWLVPANNRHAAVVVAINTTDGRGRTKKNVTAVRAVMLDLDGKPLDPVQDCNLTPHMITETSKGHY